MLPKASSEKCASLVLAFIELALASVYGKGISCTLASTCISCCLIICTLRSNHTRLLRAGPGSGAEGLPRGVPHPLHHLLQHHWQPHERPCELRPDTGFHLSFLPLLHWLHSAQLALDPPCCTTTTSSGSRIDSEITNTQDYFLGLS